MLIWIKSLSDLRQHLFNDNGEINEEIINEIIKYFEPIKTTSFDYKEEKKVPLIKDIADSENIEESICVEVVIWEKKLIIVVRNEKRKNWLYVVWSRMKTRKGLFLYRKLNMSDIQEPDSSYLNDEPRLKELEQQILTSKEKHRINKK